MRKCVLDLIQCVITIITVHCCGFDYLENLSSFTADTIFPLTTLEVLKFIRPVVQNWELLSHQRQIASTWYLLGLELGIPDKTLDVIEHEYGHDLVTCERKMVQEWLKSYSPSLYSLIVALKKVSKRYTFGKCVTMV